MLELETKLELTSAAIKSPNLCDRFSEDDLKRLGASCYTGFVRDDMSRLNWLRRNEAGMDLALQVQKDKSFPWPGASNIMFPIVTIAALQFHARAYPALVNGKDLVGMQVIGDDADGTKTARANRIKVDMSWQCTIQDKGWEPQQDKLLLNLSIVGTNFKKSYNDSSKRHNVSELVLAKNFVVDYWSTSIEGSPRKTHIIPMSRNDIRERCLDGRFREKILEEAWFKGIPQPTTTQQRTHQDNRQGVQAPPPDETTSFETLEQHVNLDLDKDGYAEPYIITLERTSQAVLRIVTRFDEDDIRRVEVGQHKGKILSIKGTEYFTKYEFIPSPDGGIYGIGFGVFLGPINESINSIINQLVDSGTMQNTAGGFLGRGAKIRGGSYTFAPFQWQRVDSTGDDLRKNIFPLPINQPSDVLFQLLSLLINYANRVSGATDMMVGENPGQNTPAETSRLMAEMGAKIYTAIFKRVWLAEKNEFEKLYLLNRKFGRLLGPIGPGGSTRDDYLGPEDGVVPAADPNVTSDVLATQLTSEVLQASMTIPGFNKDEAVRRWLRARKVEAIDQLFPGSEGQEPPKDPKILIQEMKSQVAMAQMQSDERLKIAELKGEFDLNEAKKIELYAKAQKFLADAQSESAYGLFHNAPSLV